MLKLWRTCIVAVASAAAKKEQTPRRGNKHWSMVQNTHKQRRTKRALSWKALGVYYVKACMRNKWTTLTWKKKNWQGLLSWLCSYLHVLSMVGLFWNIGISCLCNPFRHPAGEVSKSSALFGSLIRDKSSQQISVLRSEYKAASNRAKKKQREVTCDRGLRTYESPRKSWNLIRPMVVSASKLGNTSPSRRPGMVGSSLQRWERRGVNLGPLA